MGYFQSLYSELGNRVKDEDVTKDPFLSRAKSVVNRAYKWVYNSHSWEWRFKTGQVTLLPAYETGTCSVTGFTGTNHTDAMVVTFSAALPSGSTGRYVKIDGEDTWHRIEYVSGVTAVLDSPIIRATASSLTFEIWKRLYHLPGEVAAITDFGRWENRWGRLDYKSFSNLVDHVADVSDDGSPESFSPFGVDNYQTTYTTGSISGTKNTSTVTGSGALWLGDVLPGDEVVVGGLIYTVKRVEGDTRLILNNLLTDDIPTGTGYEIRRNLSVGFQFYPNKMDTYLTVPYYYYDRVFDMVHDDDRTNLPDDFDDAIISRAEFKIKKDKGDSNWTIIAQLFKSELDDCKINFRVARPRSDTFAPEVRKYPGRSR